MTNLAHVRPQRLLTAVLSLVVVVAALAPSISAPAPLARAQDEPVPSGDVIVVLEEDATLAEVRAEATDEGVQPEVVFTEVIDAFVADVTAAEAEALAADPDVAGVFPDSPVYAAAQEIPTGVDRIGADENVGADIDGSGPGVDVDVAVLDSGIDAAHLDLDVQPAIGDNNCQDTGSYDTDDTGHGTHVAGIVGAIDNDRDIVGVAPGARLHSVKVLKSDGGTISTLICGLEWAVANANVIDVVNMSITGEAAAGEDLDACAGSPLHTAVCATVAAGIPIIVSAGNTAVDAKLTIPATYQETIAVSALSDLDGVFGAAATTSCNSAYQDDTFASYSNFGPEVDIAAPGSCIRSTRAGGGLVSKSGSSMAAPHVAGAAALYLAANPGASPADVRAWLLGAGSQPQKSLVGFTGDPDGNQEPVLWLGADNQPTMTPIRIATSTPTATSTSRPTTSYRLSGGGRSPNSASYTYIRDRNLATSWKTNRFASGPPASAFVYTDLGSPKPIGTIRWIFGEYGYADVFRVEVSNDLSTWTRITRRNGKPRGQWIEARLSAPVTARYVRFFFENPNRDLYLGGLAEIQVWAPSEASPLATATPTPTPPPALGDSGAYAIVDSTQSSNSLDASLAYDGSQSTSWRTSYGNSSPLSAEARFQIGSVQRIGTVRWVFNVGGRADAFVIQLSDDGNSWGTVFSGGNAPSGVGQEVEVAGGETAKFVRFVFSNPNGDAVVGSLAEVEIYPPLVSAGLPSPSATSSATPSGSPSATAIPTETPADTPEPTGTPTQPPVDAAPATGDEPPTPAPTETPAPDVDPKTATTVAEPDSPSETPTPSPASTPIEIATIAPAAAAEEPTTESQEPGADLIPVVGVRRSSNTANGWTALDSDPATVWRTTVVPPGSLAILALDLGAPVEVSALRLLVAEDGFAGALTVEVSDDLTTWSAVATSTAADLPAGAWATLSFNAPVQTRYVRLVVVNPGDLDILGGAAELEVAAA
ncbi:MAG: hypothetical protein AVDCRST_MAG70-400 [uncultured Thermomicrobiales bacterium]|uniref:F5/8 type C domain-containing protein n=1 Tax=uncultured Thermomicrobiales bacterium TaxID=1645740 RepID=A0A6J4U9W3_9BACT|nr:MAG: hypothetical protein AVDCRST_MAG70-400 [uncultured Thermomicrobiales bacterium]CAA9568776.1 MAG: hypothetical protein AVDCRST_MAG59-3268 [uncultured Thermomicrobiales bacterium]